mgnify:CR=1 FL=1
MKARNGQVALYLVMVLLAIAVLMVVNINAFLAVRSKNRMMNAVDEAAIAAAKHQGALLNKVGQLNVEHLRAAVLGEDWVDEQGNSKMAQMTQLVFIGPVEGIAKANAAARDWGYEGGADPEALAGFADHIAEILNNPEFYPPGRDNVWGAYADALARALGGNPTVVPSFMEMVHPGATGLFARMGFYDVLAAKAWCWFSVGNNAALLDQDPTQMEEPEINPVEVPENSEVFSLHVTYGGWMDSDWAQEWRGNGFSEKWTNFVCQVTGLLPEDFSKNSTAADEDQVWAFYDGNWKPWSTTFNPDNLPIAGALKPEYDVAGCVASCMMIGYIPQIAEEDGCNQGRRMLVSAEAKPFGTVEDLDGGGPAPVTAYNNFIAPSRPGERIFTEAQLVLVGTVPRSPGASMSPDWYEHVKKHSPQHPSLGCGYCKLWSEWSNPSTRYSSLNRRSTSMAPLTLSTTTTRLP